MPLVVRTIITSMDSIALRLSFMNQEKAGVSLKGLSLEDLGEDAEQVSLRDDAYDTSLPLDEDGGIKLDEVRK